MAEGRLRVIGVPPSGPGLKRALSQLLKDGTVVTSFDDAKLRALRALAPHDREIEFAPIGDLVGRFLTMLGEPIARLCPKGQLQETVSLACRDLNSDSPLSASSRFRGTAELIADRLGDLRDWQVTSNDLLVVAERASPALAARLVSLAEVDDSVWRVMEETNRQFSATRVNRCLELPPDRTLPIRRIVVAVAGTEKPLYESWIQWVSGFGIETIVLLDNVPGADHLFASSARCAKRLGQQMTEDGTAHWCKALFTKEEAEGAPSTSIVDTADPLSESEWAVRGCLEEIEAGVLPHKIAVFARDPETYGPLLRSAAERLGVPLSASISTPLLTNGFAALLLRCLEALAGDDVRAIARLATSSYIRGGLTNNEELMQASREAFLQGQNQWDALLAWSRGTGEEYAWLTSLLEWRAQVLANRIPLSGWLPRLRELAGATQMIEAAASSVSDTKDRDVRAQTVLQRSIADLAYVYDRAERPALSLEAFVELAKEVWENETFVVEGKPNGVVLVAHTGALTEYETLFVVGMLEGTLPRRRREDPILDDEHRKELSELLGRGWRIPDSRTDAAAERDEIVRICCAASKRIVFSYPQTDESRDNVPAFYLEEIRRACPGTVSVTRPRSHFVPVKPECRADSDVRTRAALDSPRKPFVPPLLASDEAKDAVRPAFEKGVSPEEVAQALMCPFQSIARHRLRLRAPARRRLMRSLRDLPAEAALVTNASPEEARAAFERAIDAYLDEVYPEFENWELSMLRAAAGRLADEWVEREFRARSLWSEPGEQTHTGVKLDEHGLKNELKIGDTRVRLHGSATSLTVRKGYSVLRFFDSSTPKMAEMTDLPHQESDAFLYGLYLMAQVHLPPNNPTIEVDGMDGRRIIAGFRRVRSELRHDPSKGIEVVCVSDSRDVFMQNVKTRLREAIEVLSRADMAAKPGDHCERCPYGELCRVSSAFGEAPDAFEEVGA